MSIRPGIWVPRSRGPRKVFVGGASGSLAVVCLIMVFALGSVACGSPARDSPITSVTISSQTTTASSSASTSNDSRELYPVQSGALWGYMDVNGKMVIAPHFEDAGYFYEGMATVVLDGKVGFIDSSGEMRIRPMFAAARPFSEGLAEACASPDAVGFIDKSGDFVVAPDYDEAAAFSEGLAAVRKATSWGFIDERGTLAIPLSFQDVGSFTEGLARAKIHGNWGYIDHTGTFVIEPTYQGTEAQDPQLEAEDPPVLHFHNGLAGVHSSDGWRFIDKTGKVAIDQTFYAVGEFSEGLAPVLVNVLEGTGGTDYRMGFIDPTGRMVVPLLFDSNSLTIDRSEFAGFHNGLAAVAMAEPAGNVMVSHVDIYVQQI